MKKTAKYKTPIAGSREISIYVTRPDFTLDYINLAIFHEDKESRELIEVLTKQYPEITRIEVELSNIFTMIYE